MKGRPFYRRPFEAVLRAAYLGGWPARAWGLSPASAAVRTVRRELALLPAGLPHLCLAFASDIHVGPTTSHRTLDAAFRVLADARPDVLALGGDYVFLGATRERVAELARRVADVPARTKVAVLGNHDRWGGQEAVIDALEGAGVEVLVNRALHLPDPHGEVAVVGPDDPMTGEPDPTCADGAARTRIVLCHSPEFLSLRTENVRLALCGHTHGGQIALPGGPIWLPGREARRYPFGHHRVGEMELVVSRGVGTSSVPVRIFAPPDVVVLDLVPKVIGSGPP